MDKKTFRKICIEKAKKRTAVNAYKLDKSLNQALYEYIGSIKSKTIMLYIPLKIEVNISSLILRLRREKKVLLVPFMEGESFSLVKYRLPLSKKQFGVKEPKNTNNYKHRIDLAIVPIIGTDETLRRVGFGKGFYDRFFEKNHARINKILFVGREYCVSSKIISDDHDVKGDFYMTAKNCHFKSYLKRKSRI
ncbi:MAG: 5-formyltetrahydrofolate cyclo-ligase (EC [uncultured Sulfurovum sp.]|uniref:5-formyltetrahydrofolate cyclo-ligase n=1 Tax=uncultured Sulfurovum sp. TaxID=269237 RepID=A0A6S6TUA1_9BACT|nr:MAG: 5-formyltetrahydrofolate cyclo-ligase (EC [uncultured Sulfurovum sp.]